jgi:hypothetical protein
MSALVRRFLVLILSISGRHVPRHGSSEGFRTFSLPLDLHPQPFPKTEGELRTQAATSELRRRDYH